MHDGLISVALFTACDDSGSGEGNMIVTTPTNNGERCDPTPAPASPQIHSLCDRRTLRQIQQHTRKDLQIYVVEEGPGDLPHSMAKISSSIITACSLDGQCV